MTFERNPREGALPQREKSVTASGTTAPAEEGNIVVFEGRDKPSTFDMSGTIASQAHYDFMVSWYDLRHQVRVTDDLGQVFWCYLTSFKPKRKNRHSHPWAADYEAQALILSWEA